MAAASGCSAVPPSREPLPGVDVACLLTATRQKDDQFDRALQVCDVAKPDLTGNSTLQKMALAAHVPFTIRPIADAELKHTHEVTTTGSLIPHRDTGQPIGFYLPAPIDGY